MVKSKVAKDKGMKKMKTVKILHCADIHIGAAESFLGEKAQSRRYETLLTFERIVDIASYEAVQLVALAGDIFDSNSSAEEFFGKVIEKIASVPQIKFVFSAGNHDPLDSHSPFIKKTLPENLFVLGGKDDVLLFHDLSLCVFGRSFESAFLKGNESFSLKPNSDYVNLMVLHGDLRSDLNSEYNSVTESFIKSSGMDYIALGHIHKRTDILKSGDTFYAYSGCPEGQGFDETDQKGVYIGEIGKGICELKFLPVARRMHICENIDVTGISSNSDIASHILSLLSEKYGDSFSENLYKLNLTGTAFGEELSLTEIKSRIESKLYFVKIKDSSSLSIDFDALAKEASLKGIFVKNMLNAIDEAPKDEKESYKKALDLGLKAFIGEVSYNED